ncbi:MAG: hypothetical protein ACI837_001453 [Crocinitomicaceae bacterium]|jgi:hypothetical protein
MFERKSTRKESEPRVKSTSTIDNLHDNLNRILNEQIAQLHQCMIDKIN